MVEVQMPKQQSLIQLSAYDPRISLPAGSPQAELVERSAEGAKGRVKTASAADQKKQGILEKFHASEDPKERMRLLEEALKV